MVCARRGDRQETPRLQGAKQYYQLHQALGPRGRLRGCAVPGLDGDDGVHQVGVDAVPAGGGIDDAGERPLAGLGRSREQASGDGDEQQEYEATAGETRRRHGERAPYHIKDRTPRVDWRSYRLSRKWSGRRGSGSQGRQSVSDQRLIGVRRL